MTTQNAYATLAEYKDYVTARGQTHTTDTTDDAVIELLLKSVSAFFDDQTQRNFYPRMETRYYDVPMNQADGRALALDGDLLEVITVVNGDGVTIPSTEYTLRPKNITPHSFIRLKDNSTYIWASDGAGDLHDVIEVTGIWGYHTKYSDAWLSDSALNEDLDTSETAVDVVDGQDYLTGDIIKYDNEINYVSSKNAHTITVIRGINGSTATTHTTGTGVFIWRFMQELKIAVLETAMQAYKRRYGVSGSNTATITAAGVVLSPKDVPTIAADFIKMHRRYA